MKRATAIILGSLLGSGGYVATEWSGETGPRDTLLFLTHSSHGNLTSCGCGDNSFGGETGKLSTIEQLQTRLPNRVVVLEGGSFTLGGKGSLDIALGRAYKRLFDREDVRVVCSGPEELVGRDALRAVGLEPVCGNWSGPSSAVKRWGIAGEFRVTSVVSPQLVDASTGRHLEDPVETVSGWLSDARRWQETPVVFLHVTRREANRIIKSVELHELMAIIVDASDGPLTPGVTVGPHVLVARLEESGKQGAVIQLRGRGDYFVSHTAPNAPGAVRVTEASVIALGKGSETLGDEILEDYGSEVSKLATCSEAYDGYLGSESCRSCHLGRYRTWEKSKHAVAMRPLRALKRHRDARCYSCHVTGDRSRCNDSLPIVAAEKLQSVGCENCHGPGAGHVEGGRPMRKVPNGDLCLSCHIGRFGGLGANEWRSICREH